MFLRQKDFLAPERSVVKRSAAFQRGSKKVIRKQKDFRLWQMSWQINYVDKLRNENYSILLSIKICSLKCRWQLFHANEKNTEQIARQMKNPGKYLKT